MLVVLAKLGTAEMMGQLALGFAIAAPAFLLTNLSFGRRSPRTRVPTTSSAITRPQSGDHRGRVAVIADIAGSVHPLGDEGRYLLVGAVKAIDAPSDALDGRMQKRERMDLIAGSIGMRGALSVVAFAARFIAGECPSGACSDIRGMGACAFSVMIFPPALAARHEDRAALGPGRSGSADAAVVPLGFTAMLILLSVMIPRYFLEPYRGEYELGAFVAMTSVTVVGGTVISALGQSASPILARDYAAGESAAVRGVLVGAIGSAALLGGRVWSSHDVGSKILTALFVLSTLSTSTHPS